MSGEGHISNIGAIRERIERHLAECRASAPTAPLLEAAPAWDKRPGALEATAPRPLVWCERGADGWRVRLTLGGATAKATPEAARALAAELTEYAALAEGQLW